MRKIDAIKRLKLFNAKSDYLLRMNFVEELKKGQRGSIARWERGKNWDSVYVGPEGETVEAFILTLRLFSQRKERISLHRIKELYEILPVPESLKAEICKMNDELSTFLNSKTGFKIDEAGAQLSYEEVFDLFVYGFLAHVDEQKHKIFTELSQAEFFPFFQTKFINVCVVYLRFINAISRLNKNAIVYLESSEL